MTSKRMIGHQVSVFFLTFFRVWEIERHTKLTQVPPVQRKIDQNHVHLCKWLNYAFFHANRKAFSNVKTTVGQVWTPSLTNDSVSAIKPDFLWNSHNFFSNNDDVVKFQGLLDTCFMVAYATGLFLNGYIGDRINMRLLLAFGMASTSVLVFVFGCVCEWTSFYNEYFYIVVWILNGLMQSTGWPVVVACMGNWFGKSSRGVLLGLWGSCASVGNIIGALLVSSVLSYGYQYAFLITSTVLFGGSFLVLFGLIPAPEEVGLKGLDDEIEGGGYSAVKQDDKTEQREPLLADSDTRGEPILRGSNPGFSDDDDDEVIHEIMASRTSGRSTNTASGDLGDVGAVVYDIKDTKPTSMSFCTAIFMPGVIPYALAYAFLKLVNYSFFFWLPFYLHNQYSWKERVADQLSTVYDIAGIVGGTVIGYASDRLGKRTVVIVPMLILSIPALFVYSNSPNDRMINSALMSLLGFFIGGASSLISSAVSADLGCQKQFSGDDKALATVTGVIDGTGSFGAALGQIAVPYLKTGLGWHSVFYLFMICMFLTALCIFPLFVKEMRTLSCCRICPSFSRRWRLIQSPTVNVQQYDHD